MPMRLRCGLKMHNKKVKRLFFIFSIILLSLFLLIGWIEAWYRYPLRLFKTKESLHFSSVDCVEILFPEQDDPNYFIITNEEMTDEILNYLNSLTLIREDLTEDEKIYNTYSMYIHLGDDTLSFGKKYLFCGKTDADDCVGINYYFYDSSMPFFKHGKSVYEFFQNFLKKYENENGICSG